MPGVSRFWAAPRRFTYNSSVEVRAFKHCQAALVYTSGFGSNAGTLLALLGETDAALIDTHCHASLFARVPQYNVETVQTQRHVLA